MPCKRGVCRERDWAANVEKLRDRQARGTMRGEGDDR